MINWQVVEQAFSAGLIFLVGPGVVLYLILRKGNV